MLTTTSHRAATGFAPSREVVPSLILASASPRRIDFLRLAGVPHAVLPVDIDETPRPGEAAVALVTRLSEEKADAAVAAVARGVGQLSASLPILTADTIVEAEGAVLGKPPHEGAARQMLRMLSGTTHRVHTGYHLRGRGSDGTLLHITRVVTTEVEVRPLRDADIAGYLRSEEWRGKAGAYGIQGRFGCFVHAVRGSYDNVVGLPLSQVISDLLEHGILPSEWPTWQP